MNEGKRLIRNTGIIAIGNLSTKLVSFFLLPLYTSLLSTSEYGVQDYINSLTVFCVPFVTVLMDEAVFRFLIDCKTDQDRKNVISMSVKIILSGLVVFTGIASPILIVTKYHFSFYFMLCVMASVLSTMTSALLRGLGKIEEYTIYNFVLSVAKIILSIFFVAIIKRGIYGLLEAEIVSGILITVIFLFRNKVWKYIDMQKSSKKEMLEMIKYSVPLIPNKLSWSVINLSDRIIIMNVIGSEASGLYAVSYKFPTLMDTIYGFFYQSWKESSARALQDENVNVFYNMVYDYLKRFMYSIVMLMTAFMPLAFKLLINNKFNEAILFVPILLLATYFANISGFYGGIFTAYKDTKIMGVTTLWAAVINIIVNLLMIWRFGLYAAAISTLVANVVVYVYRKIKVQKYIVLEEKYAVTIISVIVMACVWVLFYTQSMICQFIGVLIAIVYSLVVNKNLLCILLSKLKNKRV